MRKKLQIFISSTYTDLREERAAAVQAVLDAGHIPAGMELFTAGDKSQLETIKQWIDESDVFMLILGVRYGSIDPESGKSYTQVEYEYAVAREMPYFAVYMTDMAVNARVKVLGSDVREDDYAKYKTFQRLVLSKICRPFSEPKDIIIATHQTLTKFSLDSRLSGWVRGKDVPDMVSLADEVTRLSRENSELRRALQRASDEHQKSSQFGRFSFDQLVEALQKIHVEIAYNDTVIATDLLSAFFLEQDRLIRGIDRPQSFYQPFPIVRGYDYDEERDLHLYTEVATRLVPFSLIEEVKDRRLKTTKVGNEFLAQLRYNGFQVHLPVPAATSGKTSSPREPPRTGPNVQRSSRSKKKSL